MSVVRVIDVQIQITDLQWIGRSLSYSISMNAISRRLHMMWTSCIDIRADAIRFGGGVRPFDHRRRRRAGRS
jgi:hypothetical protein